MAVSKELYERYKKMKAEGINISLSELKQQMENENPPELSNSGFSSFSSQNSGYSEPSISPQNNSLNQTSDYDSNSQASLWSNSYSNSNSFDNQESLESAEQSPYTGNVSLNQQSYDSNYSNSFNSDYMEPKTPESYSNSGNEISNSEFSSVSYTGNISSNINTEVNNNLSEDKINSQTRKFCLIGYPLGHSLSTYIHDAGFKSLGLKASYEILETPPETLVDRIKFLKTNNYAGFNVTIPLKLPVTMFLDEVDASADIVHAVNTVSINPETKTLKGYNTDVIGFKNAIPEDFVLVGKVAGVLGTGGAARAAITGLAQSQVKEIKIYTRNIPNSVELLAYLRKTFPRVEFNALQIENIRDLSDVNILVNATPIGMQGVSADMTPVEERELTTLPSGALVYDVIYNPKKTVFIKLAQKHGYRTVNGVDMFIHQALAAEQIWTGKTPDFKDMKISALENL